MVNYQSFFGNGPDVGKLVWMLGLKVLAMDMLISVGVKLARYGVIVPAMVAAAEDPVYFKRIQAIIAILWNLLQIWTIGTGRIE